jgi:hypothetical protein
MATIIGTSGWSYDHREPALYPPGLPAGNGSTRAKTRSMYFNNDGDANAVRNAGTLHRMLG